MNCNEIRNLIPFYADGEIGREDADRVRSHLAGCPSCRKEYDAVSALLGRAADILAEPVSVDPGAYLAALRRRIDDKRRISFFPYRAIAVAAAVLAVVSAGMFAFMLGGGFGVDQDVYVMEDSSSLISEFIEPDDLDAYDLGSLIEVVEDIGDDMLVNALLASSYGDLRIEDILEMMDDDEIQVMLTSYER